MRGVWIAGTDTDIGKTYITAQLLSHLRKDVDALPMKPVQTGSVGQKAPDLEYCLHHARLTPTDKEYSLMCPYLFEPACSPHLAAKIAQRTIDIDYIRQCANSLWKSRDFLVIEGAGGLLVPINEHQTMLDLMKALPLPVLLVARGGLGTINHTLLSLKALREASLPIVGVILNDAVDIKDDFIRKDNPQAISLLGNIDILDNVYFGSSLSGESYARLYNVLSNAS